MTTASSATASKKAHPVQAFFQEVHGHLLRDDLPKAREALKKGTSDIHPALPKNIDIIDKFISKEGLDAARRANRLVNVIFTKDKTSGNTIFPELDPAPFSQEKSVSSSTKVQAAAKKSEPEILKKVKAIGLSCGLSPTEVNNALEEITLEDGSQFWVVNVEHSQKYQNWQMKLSILAIKKKLFLFREGLSRTDAAEIDYLLKLKDTISLTTHKEKAQDSRMQECFRGLETPLSYVRLTFYSFYRDFFGMSLDNKDEFMFNYEKPNPIKIAKFIGILLGDFALFNEFPAAIQVAKPTSKVAQLLLEVFSKAPPHEQRDEFNKYVSSEALKLVLNGKISPKEWVEFLETMLPIVYKGSPEKVSLAIEAWLKSAKAITKADIQISALIKKQEQGDKHLTQEDEDLLESLLSINHAVTRAREGFEEAIRPFRDIDYAEMFLSNWTDRSIPGFVTFGRNHRLGFKTNVLALSKQKGISKTINGKSDEKKAESKENDGKADAKKNK